MRIVEIEMDQNEVTTIDEFEIAQIDAEKIVSQVTNKNLTEHKEPA